MLDVLERVDRKVRQVLDYGFVGLVDCMPRLVDERLPSADFAIVEAARQSYAGDTLKKTPVENRGLLRYAMRHRHTSPFEMVEFKFHCKMPIFVARQWIRHRTANVNEKSGRYSVLNNEMYLPELENVRAQSKTNKQGSDVPIDQITAASFQAYIEEHCSKAYERYEEAIKAGIGKEQARMILPLNLYTEWFWKIDLHNLLHFLGLRCDSHAQMEIRVFADQMLDLITPIVPWTVEAWNDYHPLRNAVLLTRLEVEAIERILQHCPLEQLSANGLTFDIETENKREQEEWKAKLGRFKQTSF